MNIAKLEALIWSQARHLASTDPLVARTAMEAVLAAVTAYTEHAAGPIVAMRRRDLTEAAS